MNSTALIKRTFKEFKNNLISYLITTLPFIAIVEFLSSLETIIPLIIFSIIILPFLDIEIYESIKNKRSPNPLNIIKFFKLKVMITNILLSIYTFLWSLLLIIPGIIKSLSYQRAIYISHNNQELSSNEAIKESTRQMKGLKSTYFFSRFLISLPNAILIFYLGSIVVDEFTEIISIKHLLYSNPTTITIIYIVISLLTNILLSVFDGVFNNKIEE